MINDDPDTQLGNLDIPAGWALVDPLVRPNFVIMEFRRGGRFDPRVIGLGDNVAEAVADAMERMQRYDEQDRERQVR